MVSEPVPEYDGRTTPIFNNTSGVTWYNVYEFEFASAGPHLDPIWRDHIHMVNAALRNKWIEEHLHELTDEIREDLRTRFRARSDSEGAAEG